MDGVGGDGLQMSGVTYWAGLWVLEAIWFVWVAGGLGCSLLSISDWAKRRVLLGWPVGLAASTTLVYLALGDLAAAASARAGAGWSIVEISCLIVSRVGLAAAAVSAWVTLGRGDIVLLAPVTMIRAGKVGVAAMATDRWPGKHRHDRSALALGVVAGGVLLLSGAAVGVMYLVSNR